MTVKAFFDIALFIAILMVLVPSIGGLFGAFFMWHLFIKKWLKEKFLTKSEKYGNDKNIKSNGGTNV